MYYMEVQTAHAKVQFLGTYLNMPDNTQWWAMSEPIEMPFGLCTWVGPRKHVLGQVHPAPNDELTEQLPVATLCWGNKDDVNHWWWHGIG